MALVSDQDFGKLNQFEWCANFRDENWYAMRFEKTGKRGYRRAIYMHKDILQAPPGKIVAHWNSNGLDNRRKNLVVCSVKEAIRKARKVKPSTSKYKGIYRVKGRGIWRARIMVDWKYIQLGGYSREKDAARAYDRGAKKYFGRFARLNFSKNKG